MLTKVDSFNFAAAIMDSPLVEVPSQYLFARVVVQL